MRTLFGTTAAATIAVIAATAMPAYASPGDFDTQFSDDGKVTTDYGVSPPEPEIGNDMVLQPDGKIIALVRAGTNTGGTGGTGAFALARYLPDGSLDSSFGTGGLVKTRFAEPPHVSLPRAVALQPDGKILVGGWEGAFEQVSNLALARYDSHGSLDTSFGTGGKVSVNLCQSQTGCGSGGDGLGDGIRDLRILPNGKILGVGANGIDNLIIRLNPNGSLDTTFGNGGFLVPALGLSGHLFAMELAENGKFLAVGTAFVASADDFLLAKFNADGSLDTTFGNGGSVTTSFTPLNDLAFEMVTTTGKIVLVGSAGAASPFGGNGPNMVAVARYNSNGSLDTTFGTGGMVTKDLSLRQDVARNVAVQSNGKIVVVGQQDEQSSFANDPQTGHMMVLRLNTNGSLDTTFGTAGVATPVVAGVGEVARGAEIDSSGRLVLVGGAWMPGTGLDVATVRLHLS
jgi:uncharacterized delta-60 repeat protein